MIDDFWTTVKTHWTKETQAYSKLDIPIRLRTLSYLIIKFKF